MKIIVFCSLGVSILCVSPQLFAMERVRHEWPLFGVRCSACNDDIKYCEDVTLEDTFLRYTTGCRYHTSCAIGREICLLQLTATFCSNAIKVQNQRVKSAETNAKIEKLKARMEELNKLVIRRRAELNALLNQKE